ncbi:conserved domain protein [delta proteobacterium NaphS2]|nr:conserved domain protein [delta proteobacterium NaphS2]
MPTPRTAAKPTHSVNEFPADVFFNIPKLLPETRHKDFFETRLYHGSADEREATAEPCSKRGFSFNYSKDIALARNLLIIN